MYTVRYLTLKVYHVDVKVDTIMYVHCLVPNIKGKDHVDVKVDTIMYNC